EPPAVRTDFPGAGNAGWSDARQGELRLGVALARPCGPSLLARWHARFDRAPAGHPSDVVRVRRPGAARPLHHDRGDRIVAARARSAADGRRTVSLRPWRRRPPRASLRRIAWPPSI